MTARLGWIATFVLLLVLAALLPGTAASSGATATTPGQSYLAFEDEEGFEDEELVEEGELEDEPGEAFEDELGGNDCELGRESLEEGLLSLTDVEELCAAEEEWEASLEGRSSQRGSSHPSCTLRSARARVRTTRRNRLRLTIRYTTREPTGATIEISRGRTRIGSFRRHLGRSGVLRIVKRLGTRPAPRRLVVRLRVAGSAGECAGKLTRRVRIRQPAR